LRKQRDLHPITATRRNRGVFLTDSPSGPSSMDSDPVSNLRPSRRASDFLEGKCAYALSWIRGSNIRYWRFAQ